MTDDSRHTPRMIMIILELFSEGLWKLRMSRVEFVNDSVGEQVQRVRVLQSICCHGNFVRELFQRISHFHSKHSSNFAISRLRREDNGFKRYGNYTFSSVVANPARSYKQLSGCYKFRRIL